MKNLKLVDVMTPLPKSVRDSMPVSEAFKLMREERCRHLPVLRDGRLVGLVSERDLHLVSKSLRKDDLPVSEAMTEKPFTVPSTSSLLDALRKMLKNKYGSVLVTDSKNNVVGIFTQIDALGLLAEELEIISEHEAEDEHFHEELKRNSRSE